MAVTLEGANSYFQNEVYLNDTWVSASDIDKQRALKNAENQLYRFYTTFDIVLKPLPDIAVYEQAYFLMLVDETIQKASLGVNQVSVAGVSISTKAVSYPISPEVRQLIYQQYGIGKVRVGRSTL